MRYFFCGSCMFFCLVFVMPLCFPCGHLLGKGWPLGSHLWCLTVSFVTFPLLSWVRCGTWLCRFQIFAAFLTFINPLPHGDAFWGHLKYYVLGNVMEHWWKLWKYYVFENVMEIEHLLKGANAWFSITFSKVFKTLLKFFLNFFQYFLKIKIDAMILK